MNDQLKQGHAKRLVKLLGQGRYGAAAAHIRGCLPTHGVLLP